MSTVVCLLVNPVAGGGRAGKVSDKVVEALRALGLQVRHEQTRDLDHARELARQAARAGETVVCLSGDGMIGAVADVLREEPGSVMGVLPGGRGNDFARVLGISPDPLKACRTIAEGVPRQVDLGEAEGRAFVGIASTGFDSECNRVANEAPSWMGRFVYLYSALRVLAGWRPARFEIKLEPGGERHGFSGYSVGAANSKAYGGGMRVAPDALLDDGLLEVLALEDVGKLAFLTKILPKVFDGTHTREPSVRMFRAAEVTISADREFALYADGDPIAQLPARVRALKGAVQVLVPSVGASRQAFASEPREAAREHAGTPPSQANE